MNGIFCVVINECRYKRVSLLPSVVITEEYNVKFNSEELIGSTEYLTL